MERMNHNSKLKNRKARLRVNYGAASARSCRAASPYSVGNGKTTDEIAVPEAIVQIICASPRESFGAGNCVHAASTAVDLKLVKVGSAG
jgi:hypothetical protein